MYRAPVDEIAFTLKHVAGLKAAVDAGRFGDLSIDLVDAILAEAGRFATEEVAPLYKAGDEHGAVLEDAAVTTPPGWKELYRRWTEGGWNALSGPVEFGGQGLPTMLGVATLEMWNSASMAFALGPTLTMGAVEALDKHASDELKPTYLAKLVSGEWMGTMNLTEPQAGSDLAALRTRAERAADGTYRIFGQKIFITYGEHDFTDNIVPSGAGAAARRARRARAASRSSSCRNSWSRTTARSARRNDVFCASIEHKLGIHGSPTCTMIYGDGFVSGEREGRGRLADRRGEQGPRLHVHHDEQRPPRRRHAGRRRRRGRLPEGARLCQRAPAGQGRELFRRGHGADRPSPRCAAQAARPCRR